MPVPENLRAHQAYRSVSHSYVANICKWGYKRWEQKGDEMGLVI